MIDVRRLITNALSSIVQTAVSGVIMFALYRYLIIHLGTEQLGLWSVVLASTSVARLGDLGMTGSVAKFVARYRAHQDEVQAAAVVKTAAISSAIILGMLLIALYPLASFLLELSIPKALIPQAMSILPWAVLSLWLGSTGGTFQAGLDGCQLIATRNILLVGGNLVLLALSVWFVPDFGLNGLAICQVVQSLLMMLAAWFLLSRKLPAMRSSQSLWTPHLFREMFGYAANFQFSTLAMLLFDPVTKLFITHFGGLSSTALYEVASQLVIKIRALATSAMQTLVPTVAALQEVSRDELRMLYLNSYGVLFYTTIPLFAAIVIVLPVFSKLLLGWNNPVFILFGTLLALGWGINTLGSLAYFFNMGTGDIKRNSYSQGVIAIVNVVLGSLLGSLFGALGVVVGSMVALAVGSITTIVMLYRSIKIPFKTLITQESYVLLGVMILSVIASSVWTPIFDVGNEFWLYEMIKITLFICLALFFMWVHPYTKLILEHYFKVEVPNVENASV